MKQKLVFLGDSSSIHTFRWVESLVVHSNYEIHLIAMNFKENNPKFVEIASQVTIHRLGSVEVKPYGVNWKYLLYIFRIRRLLIKLSPTIICSIYLSSYGLISSLVKPKGTKLIHIIIGSDIMVFPWRSPLHRLFTRFSLKMADLLVSASHTATSRIIEIYRHPNVLTQQYGIKSDIAKHRCSEKKYAIASNRAWVENSNIPMILDLFNSVDFGNKSIAMIGTPSDLLTSLTAKYGKVFTFLPVLCQEENFSIVGQSEFYISLTSSDGASLSVMEAMYLGAIPVLSDILPNREWVVNGRNGFLIPLDNFKLAKAVINQMICLTDSDRRSMVEENNRIIEERGLIENNVKIFLKRLDSIRK